MKMNLANIKKAKKLLHKRECIAIPTETVYGLAGNAYSDQACQKIYKLKKRPKNNPLIVHYLNIQRLKKDCHLNNDFIRLYKKFCPGPLTFILKLKKENSISRYVTNNSNNLAVRFPKHPITRLLLKKLNFPLAAPSANKSTSISPVTREDVIEEFGTKIKYVINGGRSKVGLESTIIDLTNNPKILRLGGIEIEKISDTIKLNLIYRPNKRNKYPGQSKLHYSPGIPIKMNIKQPKKNSAYLLINKRKKNNKNFFYLSKNRNLKEAGKNLYKILRNIKKKRYKLIEVEKIPNISFGKVINDRLLRASTK